MKLEFRWVKWEDIRPDILPLWEAHNVEIASPSDQELFDPDWDRFDALAAASQDHWLVAYREGRMVGYAFAIVTTHLHRKGTLSAFYDLYWLQKDCRRGLNGYRMMKAMENSLKARGVRKLYSGTKMWKDVGVLFKRMAWVETERLYTKVIG